MRFLGSKFTQNALAAGVPPRIPLGLERSPRPRSRFQGPLRGRGKGKEGKEGGGKGEKGEWGKERGREGKGKGEGGKGEGGREGEVCVIARWGDRRPCCAMTLFRQTASVVTVNKRTIYKIGQQYI